MNIWNFGKYAIADWPLILFVEKFDMAVGIGHVWPL